MKDGERGLGDIRVPGPCCLQHDRPGRLVKALPALRSRIDVAFGDPFEAGDGSGRRTRAALDEATLRIQRRLTDHLAEARRRTER